MNEKEKEQAKLNKPMIKRMEKELAKAKFQRMLFLILGIVFAVSSIGLYFLLAGTAMRIVLLGGSLSMLSSFVVFIIHSNCKHLEYFISGLESGKTYIQVNRDKMRESKDKNIIEIADALDGLDEVIASGLPKKPK